MGSWLACLGLLFDFAGVPFLPFLALEPLALRAAATTARHASPGVDLDVRPAFVAAVVGAGHFIFGVLLTLPQMAGDLNLRVHKRSLWYVPMFAEVRRGMDAGCSFPLSALGRIPRPAGVNTA